ncbi:MAG: TetR/AcrR family transcriptional regulator [Solirubrobacteraceae bacterium]
MSNEMEGSGGPGEPRPLRVDAERNLRRLFDVAREAFAEEGLGVSVDEIARRAGVGKGTVFRRFETKEQLIAAVIRDRLEEGTRVASALLAEPDAGVALREFMRLGAELQARDRGFFEAVAQTGLTDEQLHSAKAELIELTAALLGRAQEQGAVRGDVTPEDVIMLQCGSVQAGAPFHDAAPELWRRYVDIAFDGLRAEGATPLSHPAPEASQPPVAAVAPKPAEQPPIVAPGSPAE